MVLTSPTEDMFARAVHLQKPVSRWRTWEELESAVEEAAIAVSNPTYAIATRGSGNCPILKAGWKAVDAGEVTVAEILSDPAHHHWLNKRVNYTGDASKTGTRFHVDGSTSTDDRFKVAFSLDSDGEYRVLSAYPWEDP